MPPCALKLLACRLTTIGRPGSSPQGLTCRPPTLAVPGRQMGELPSAIAKSADGTRREVPLTLRIDTPIEVD